MAGSPNIPQGFLNRLAVSVTFPSNPQLTVTPSFLGKAGVSLRFNGDAVKYIPTMVGNVLSPEPYQMGELTINLLKSQPLATLYEAQRQTNAQVGNSTVRTDAATLGPYKLFECAIQTIRDLDFSGEDAGYGVVVVGYYPINSNLWS